MKASSLTSSTRRILAGVAVAGILSLAALLPVQADDSTNAPDATPPAPKKKISGVELYAIHCNRCHPERYPVEFNESQWKTIMLHMKVRANIPAEQAKEIMKYLQEEAGY